MKKLLLVSTLEIFAPKLDSALKDLPLANMNVVCISTAANVYESPDWLEREKAPIKQRAKSFITYDIAGKTVEDTAAALAGADAIYVTGGNTYYLLEQAKHCRFQDVLKTCFQRGALYIGSSAGAIVTCPRIDFIGDMDDPAQVDLEDFSGLGLIDWLVLPHIDHVKYGPKARLLAEQKQPDNAKIIGLRDDQGLYIQDNYVQIY